MCYELLAIFIFSVDVVNFQPSVFSFFVPKLVSVPIFVAIQVFVHFSGVRLGVVDPEMFSSPRLPVSKLVSVANFSSNRSFIDFSGVMRGCDPFEMF